MELNNTHLINGGMFAVTYKDGSSELASLSRNDDGFVEVISISPIECQFMMTPTSETTKVTGRMLNLNDVQAIERLVVVTESTPIYRDDSPKQLVPGRYYKHISGHLLHTLDNRSVGVIDPGELPVVMVFRWEGRLKLTTVPVNTTRFSEYEEITDTEFHQLFELIVVDMKIGDIHHGKEEPSA